MLDMTVRTYFPEKIQGVFTRGERVHQHELDFHTKFLSHLDDLFGSQIQKSILKFSNALEFIDTTHLTFYFYVLDK